MRTIIVSTVILIPFLFASSRLSNQSSIINNSVFHSTIDFHNFLVYLPIFLWISLSHICLSLIHLSVVRRPVRTHRSRLSTRYSDAVSSGRAFPDEANFRIFPRLIFIFLSPFFFASLLSCRLHVFFFIRTTFFEPRLSVLKNIAVFSFRYF